MTLQPDESLPLKTAREQGGGGHNGSVFSCIVYTLKGQLYFQNSFPQQTNKKKIMPGLKYYRDNQDLKPFS